MHRNQDLSWSPGRAGGPGADDDKGGDGRRPARRAGILPTGQVTGVVDEVPTVAELLDRIEAPGDPRPQGPARLTLDLDRSCEELAFREEAADWLAASLAAWRDQLEGPVLSGDTREGFEQHLVWEQMLFEDRWAVVSWPEPFGGRVTILWEWLIFEEEYYRAGGPPWITQNGIFLLAPSVFSPLGSSEQKEHILPRMARGR